MSRICLLGTVHADLDGSRRLRRALDIEKPDILTVEASYKLIDHISRNRNEDIKICLEELSKKRISKKTFNFFKEYMEMPSNFEVDECMCYSNEKKIPCHLIDDPGMVDLLRGHFRELFVNFIQDIDPKDIDNISRKDVILGHDILYKRMQNLYDGKISAIDGEKKLIDVSRGSIIGRRDDYEARKLIKIVEENDGAKIVHVGGCLHNMDDSKGETLYSRLKNYNPIRRTLLSYD